MIWLKAVAGGFIGAIAAAVLAIVLAVSWSALSVPAGAGSGAIAVVVMGTQVLALLAIGFAAGFWWTLRRARRVSHAFRDGASQG
jgi:hypothetical protein